MANPKPDHYDVTQSLISKKPWTDKRISKGGYLSDYSILQKKHKGYQVYVFRDWETGKLEAPNSHFPPGTRVFKPGTREWLAVPDTRPPTPSVSPPPNMTQEEVAEHNRQWEREKKTMEDALSGTRLHADMSRTFGGWKTPERTPSVVLRPEPHQSPDPLPWTKTPSPSPVKDFVQLNIEAVRKKP